VFPCEKEIPRVTVAFIGLGSNLGDREGTIRETLRRLNATPGVRVLAVSTLIETDPVGGPEGQPRFLNGAAKLETDLAPRALLEAMLEIERALGRTRDVRWSARTIDLDLLVYGDLQIDEPGLIVPHPRMRERPFVMDPLAELGYNPARMPPATAHGRLVDAIPAMREVVRAARRAGKTIGFVPTMGALHEGHIALARRARADCDLVVTSIFVNPLQFGPSEDFSRYPRDLEGDRRLLDAVPVDVVFTTTPSDMYPEGYRTYVVQDDLPTKLEGKSRPTHFRGVLTVVLKLFQIVAPDRAYFGQKDLQQTVVLRRMVEDLNVPLEMIVCPTVREADGLAMSSRNRYLSADERRDALALSRGLFAADDAFRGGEQDAERLRACVRESIGAAVHARLDYADVVSTRTLDPVTRATAGDAVVVAAYVGKTRLIDNLILSAACQR
jgi:pantoate--beta-alanine ligase